MSQGSKFFGGLKFLLLMFRTSSFKLIISCILIFGVLPLELFVFFFPFLLIIMHIKVNVRFLSMNSKLILQRFYACFPKISFPCFFSIVTCVCNLSMLPFCVALLLDVGSRKERGGERGGGACPLSIPFIESKTFWEQYNSHDLFLFFFFHVLVVGNNIVGWTKSGI